MRNILKYSLLLLGFTSFFYISSHSNLSANTLNLEQYQKSQSYFLQLTSNELFDYNQHPELDSIQEIQKNVYTDKRAELVLSNAIGSRLSSEDIQNVTASIWTSAEKYQFDPLFLAAMIEGESRFKLKAKGRFGELGLMQIKPDTALWIIEKYKLNIQTDSKLIKTQLFDPKINIEVGSALLNHLRLKFKGRASLYVTAYNKGPQILMRRPASNSHSTYFKKLQTNYLSLYSKFEPQTKNIAQANMKSKVHRMSYRIKRKIHKLIAFAKLNLVTPEKEA